MMMVVFLIIAIGNLRKNKMVSLLIKREMTFFFVPSHVRTPVLHIIRGNQLFPFFLLLLTIRYMNT
jgi:putative effector of murein hydrolase LrgA (UPF0299 family)